MKTAMIWGAAGGVGSALIEALNQEEWTTVALSRRPDALEGVADFSFAADVEVYRIPSSRITPQD